MRLHFYSRATALAVLVPALWATSDRASASDHTNLEEGLPVQVEDTTPTAYRNRELQLQGRYERASNGDNQFVIDPRFEFGFARNWQGKITVPFRLAGGDRTGSGNIGVELFRSLNTESLSKPAFALSARADFPSGENARGVDSQFKFIATKTLGRGQHLQRVHLNFIYFNNAKATANERSNRYGVVLGYSQRLNADTILVADYVHQQERQQRQTSDILEVGVRRQVTPLRTLSFGLGAGVSGNSPDFRITAGVQQAF